MTQVETRTYAGPAIRTKRDIPDPDKRLERILDRKPGVSDVVLAGLFMKAASPEELKAAIIYYVHNRRIPIERYVHTMEPEEYLQQSEVRRTRRVKTQTITQETLPTIRQTILLGLEMPNGKVLRDCTFREVKGFGGGFTKLATMGKPTQKVGILSEDRVRSAFK